MKNRIKLLVLSLVALSLLNSAVFAQLLPPGAGGGCTNCPPYTYNYTPMPYVPGLKLSIPSFSGSNLPINLLEADPAGTYDIFSASNLMAATWNDVLQGTNGQTNFTLPLVTADMAFFRAARTDTPVVNTASMTASFPNNFVNTNLISASISGGPAAAMAVLVNDTNLADAVWIPFSAVPYVLLGTNDGTYQVEFGFIGSDGQTNWTSASVTLDTTPPALVITNPTNATVDIPMIQLQGYSPEALSSISYDFTNAAGLVTNQQILVLNQYYDTTTWKFTTNYFQAFDVMLTNGVNTFIFHATDLAGNVTTTNFSVTLDYSGKTNPPNVQVTWPQDGTQIGGNSFTVNGQVADATVTVAATITDTNGDTNMVNALVERTGKFWLENLPVNSGTNTVTLIATDAAGNSTTNSFNVVQSAVTLTVDAVADPQQLWQPTANLTGTISDDSYAVWVNGVKGVNNGDGTWSANNVPVNDGGTASFTATAYAPDEQQPDGSYGN